MIEATFRRAARMSFIATGCTNFDVSITGHCDQSRGNLQLSIAFDHWPDRVEKAINGVKDSGLSNFSCCTTFFLVLFSVAAALFSPFFSDSIFNPARLTLLLHTTIADMLTLYDSTFEAVYSPPTGWVGTLSALTALASFELSRNVPTVHFRHFFCGWPPLTDLLYALNSWEYLVSWGIKCSMRRGAAQDLDFFLFLIF